MRKIMRNRAFVLAVLTLGIAAWSGTALANPVWEGAAPPAMIADWVTITGDANIISGIFGTDDGYLIGEAYDGAGRTLYTCVNYTWNQFDWRFTRITWHYADWRFTDVNARIYNRGAFNDATINAAIAEIGTTNKKTLYLAPGTWTISDPVYPVTVPPNINLRFEQGAVLSIGTGIVFTINGPLDAPIAQIFDGAGSVSFGPSNNVFRIGEVYPQWWGAKADASTDDLTAINKAMAAHKKVRLIGTYRVSGPVVVPNAVSLYGGQDGNAQNWDALTANGTLGFTGNYLIQTTEQPDPGTGVYNTFANLTLNTVDINNSSFTVFHVIAGSETSTIKNISFYIQNSSIGRYLYFRLGPVIIENINCAYVSGNVSCANEPIYINGDSGLILRNLNYFATGGTKGPYIVAAIFGLLEGLNIEDHPTTASEPAITIVAAPGISVRDCTVKTTVANSTGILVGHEAGTGDVGYLLENITYQTAGTGSWDKLVVLKQNSSGATRYWDAARLKTSSKAVLPNRLIRFTPNEQIFAGVDTNYGPHTFKDTFLFDNVASQGTITIPFNPRVRMGADGVGHILIAINGRITPTSASNRALIWMVYYDRPAGATAANNYIVGSSTSNWSSSYANSQITLTNKNANTAAQVVVSLIHSTYNLWP